MTGQSESGAKSGHSIKEIANGWTEYCRHCLGTGTKSVYVGRYGGAIKCSRCGGDGIA